MRADSPELELPPATTATAGLGVRVDPGWVSCPPTRPAEHTPAQTHADSRKWVVSPPGPPPEPHRQVTRSPPPACHARQRRGGRRRVHSATSRRRRKPATGTRMHPSPSHPRTTGPGTAHPPPPSTPRRTPPDGAPASLTARRGTGMVAPGVAQMVAREDFTSRLSEQPDRVRGGAHPRLRMTLKRLAAFATPRFYVSCHVWL